MAEQITDIEEFLSTARDRFDFGRQADAEDRDMAEYCNKFANADSKNLFQWDEAAKKARKRRPIVQWNRIHTSVQSVVNDGRQNKPSILIAPDDQGSPETAEYFKARIRHIEYESAADIAKDTARDQQVTSGRGFIRVSTEYVPGSKKQRQRICIDRIENQFSVVWDPAAIKYDRSDADWCFIISQISKDAHKRRFGDKSVVNRLDFASAMRLAPDWIGVGNNNELIQIAEYWVNERDSDGNTTSVCQYIINGAEVLQKFEWMGSTIPIVPVWGREATLDGKRRTFSLVHNAIHPQQMLNIYVSNLAELIGQMPKTPYLVPTGAIPAGMENVYAELNNSPRAYVYYEPYDSQGRPIPAPSRVAQEPPIQACVVGINQSIDAIKAAMGIYDAALGAKSNENSGVAIQRRKVQSSITNYHFPDNEARSNKYLGEILVELIPMIDKAGGAYPVRTEDGKTHIVPVGVPHADYKSGNTVTHDLKQGQYSVTVHQGPSYDSARQEQKDVDTERIKANPELMYAIGGDMLRLDDVSGAEDRAEKWEKYVNTKIPGMFPPKDQEQGKVDVSQVQQALAQKDAELQQAHQFASQLHEQLEAKIPEIQSQEKLKQMEMEFKYAELAEKSRVELAKLGVSTDITRLELEIEALKHQAGLQADAQAQQMDSEAAQMAQASDQQHESAEGEAARQHEMSQADMANQQAMVQQDVSHQHTMEQQTAAQKHAAQLAKQTAAAKQPKKEK